MNKVLKRIKLIVEVGLAILFIIFEELIWDKLVKPIKEFINKHVTEEIVIYIRDINKYLILGIFLLILSIAEVLGIVAGLLFVQGLILIAAITYFFKILIAGITFWLFGIAKDKLLSIEYFKKGYDFIMKIKDWITDTKIYKNVKEKIVTYKNKIKSYFTGKGRLKEIYKKIKERRKT